MVFRNQNQLERSTERPNVWGEGWGHGVYGRSKDGVTVNGGPGVACGIWPISRRHAIMAAHTANPAGMVELIDDDGVAHRIADYEEIGNDLAVITVGVECPFSNYIPLWTQGTTAALRALVIVAGTSGFGDGTQGGTQWVIPKLRHYTKSAWIKIRERTFPRRKPHDRAGAPGPDKISAMGDTQGPDVLLPSTGDDEPILSMGDSSGGVFVETLSDGWLMAGVILSGGNPAAVAPIASETIREFRPGILDEIDRAGGIVRDIPEQIEPRVGSVTHLLIDRECVHPGSVSTGVRASEKVIAGDVVEAWAVPKAADKLTWSYNGSPIDAASVTVAAMNGSPFPQPHYEVVSRHASGAQAFIKFLVPGTFWLFGSYKQDGQIQTLGPAVVNVAQQPDVLVLSEYKRISAVVSRPPTTEPPVLPPQNPVSTPQTQTPPPQIPEEKPQMPEATTATTPPENDGVNNLTEEQAKAADTLDQWATGLLVLGQVITANRSKLAAVIAQRVIDSRNARAGNPGNTGK